MTVLSEKNAAVLHDLQVIEVQGLGWKFWKLTSGGWSECCKDPQLGGGFKYFLFSSLFGEDFQFD